MSDSDDTDVLLLIPPDLFIIHSSDSDECADHTCYSRNKTEVVSELIEHVQSLETRISAIESKDSLEASFNNSVDLFQRVTSSSPTNHRHSLPRTKFSVSQNSSLQSSPVKVRQCLGRPPTNYFRFNHTNETQHVTRLDERMYTSIKNNSLNANTHSLNEHDDLTSFSESKMTSFASKTTTPMHAGDHLAKKEQCSTKLHDSNVIGDNIKDHRHRSLPSLNFCSKLTGISGEPNHLNRIKEMNITEVDELLQEMEGTRIELARRIKSTSETKDHLNTHTRSPQKNSLRSNGLDDTKYGLQSLSYDSDNYKLTQGPPATSPYSQGKKFEYLDYSLPSRTSSHCLDNEKILHEYNWTPNHTKMSMPKTELSEDQLVTENVKSSTNNVDQLPTNSNNSKVSKDLKPLTNNTNSETTQHMLSIPNSETNVKHNSNSVKSYNFLLDRYDFSRPNMQNMEVNLNEPFLKISDVQETCGSEPFFTNSQIQNTESDIKKSQRLIALSDFWENDSNKSKEELLRIKVEEERFRREHCEQMIQELQRRLLEQQEKVAVAIRVDNEKNAVISQFQGSWYKIKQRLESLETENHKLQNVLENTKEKHESELSEGRSQIKRYEGELSKALDLAAGYKEKSDTMVKEKVDLLKNHADELQNYKLLVQEAENRYDQIKSECNKLLVQNQQTDETLQNVRQELNKERLRGSEIRSEMAVIHKALDTCETELTDLRQEKENLQFKIKEEIVRNQSLEQGKQSLLLALDEAKNAEKAANEYAKTLSEQNEKVRSEMREVYQNQLDKVVKAKLQEYQSELDAAELNFQADLEAKQRTIAECAARKIKSFIDKHQLEINLIEEKHKEEKRLYEIQLSQVKQKLSMLEVYLSNQRTNKNQQVEQLHTFMQTQWQQALNIIAGGNSENLVPFQRLNVDKFFEITNQVNQPPVNTYNADGTDLTKSKSQNCAFSLPKYQAQESHENKMTIVSTDDTPLTSKKETKETKNDLRKYIKMILDMQQTKDNFSNEKFTIEDESSSCLHKENRTNHGTEKEVFTSNDNSTTWQPMSDLSIHDTSEYLSVPYKLSMKSDMHRQKPPWK